MGVIVHDFRTPTKQILFALDCIIDNSVPIEKAIDYVNSLNDQDFKLVIRNLKNLTKRLKEKFPSQIPSRALDLAFEVNRRYKADMSVAKNIMSQMETQLRHKDKVIAKLTKEIEGMQRIATMDSIPGEIPEPRYKVK